MHRQDANHSRRHVSASPVCEGMRLLARSYRRGTRLDTHMHREAQLIFAERGVMQVTTPKGRWLVPPARAVWVPPRLPHAIDVLADTEMRALYAEPDWLATHPEAPRLMREFVVAVGPLLRESVLALFGDQIHQRRAEVLAELVLYELAEAEDAATFVPMPADARARHVAALVLADPLVERDLDDLALAAGASPRTVTRLFPSETGLTFREWRRRARIMAAAEMLSSGSRPVKDVSSRFGFSSVAAFGHAFREIMGMTPGEFQRRSVLFANSL
jgi:AraC-like DNA-binding protein